MDQGLRRGTAVISWQVVQEFLNVARHKWEKTMTTEQAAAYTEEVLIPLCRVYPRPAIWISALNIQKITQYRFYDSLIIASALEANVSTLYSEDLQSGRTYQGLLIQNPFE